MENTNLVNFEDTFFPENIIFNELASRGYEFLLGRHIGEKGISW
jgi:hypothetical protein